MAGKKVIVVGFSAGLALGFFGWKMTARGAYESASYAVLTADAPYELREYPDLMMATTPMKVDARGRDGSFMRLFRYISGANDKSQKVAMTTPVFTEVKDKEEDEAQGEMGFVIPEKVAAGRIPEPSGENVRLKRRVGGKFAVIRFGGRATPESNGKAEQKLRAWMDKNDLVGDGNAEYAGYDPPWTPGPLRRNEILIRVKAPDAQSSQTGEQSSEQDDE